METYTYIGRKACGCIVCACKDRPEWSKDTAKSLADWVRRGLTIERITDDAFVAGSFGCKCKPANPNQKALFA